jgi:hypothetical protein
MKKIFNKITILIILLIVGHAQAQPSKDFTNNVLGAWVGTGTLFQQKASFGMKWENVLNSKFIKLSFENRFVDQSGVERIMKANAYYNVKQNKGYWFDTRGVMLPLKLDIKEDSMTVFWGDEFTETGKTLYTIVNNELSVQDYVFKNNSYFHFGKAIYKKEKE